MDSHTGSAALHNRLEALVEATVDVSTSWQVTTDRPTTVWLPDRRITVEQRAGPDSTHRWTVVLHADETVVSKFGQFETVAEVEETVRSLVDTDVHYTVCCDG